MSNNYTSMLFPYPFGLFRKNNVRTEFRELRNIDFDTTLEILSKIQISLPPAPLFELPQKINVRTEFRG